jgi:nucleotide-binding universal stress UspA family protein
MPSTTIKNILVATDFSVCSQAALFAAAEWAREWGAAIDVVHVALIPSFPLPPAVAGGEAAYRALIEEPRERAEAELKHLVENASNAGIYVRNTLLETGEVADSLCRLAARGHYDVLVLGTHGHTGITRLVLGSVAEKVVRTASCPVLTVHSRVARRTLAA